MAPHNRRVVLVGEGSGAEPTVHEITSALERIGFSVQLVAARDMGAGEQDRARPPVLALRSGSPVAVSKVTGSSPPQEAGDVVVDESGRRAWRGTELLMLTRLEFDLLAHLVRNRNRVATREALLAAVWHNEPVTPNAIEAVVSKLRTKLELHGPRVIHTVRSVGYVLRAG